MKRIVSLLLAVSMVLSMFVTAIAATTYPDLVNDNAKFAAAVDALTELGVVNGFPDGEFKPGNDLTRAELAKMVSKYAINILKKERNTNEECIFNDITNELDIKYDNGITHACELWLMWQNIKEFRPNDWVTRAEFGTVLSRALWWNKNEWGSTYYENHLKALKAEWIMNKIDTPTNREIRWYVMLMLMRSIDDTPQIQKKSDIDNQISDVIKMLE